MQLTAYLSSLTKSANILNDVSFMLQTLTHDAYDKLQLVDKHIVIIGRDERSQGIPGRRRGPMGGRGMEWDRMH